MLTVFYGKRAFTGVFVTALLCDLLDRDELVREDQFSRSYSLNQTHVIITITYNKDRFMARNINENKAHVNKSWITLINYINKCMVILCYPTKDKNY